MSEELMIYIDGQFYPKSEAKISVYDHGLLYGDGVFEGIRAYGGSVFKLDEHMKRLYSSARAIKLKIPLTRKKLTEAVVETIRKNKLKTCYIRLVVTRGVGALGVDPAKCARASVIIIAQPLEALHGGRSKERGVSAVIVSTRRDIPSGTTHEIKSLNYLNSVLAKLEAHQAGADEAILLDSRGFVSEATVANLFVVKDGVVVTPPPTAGILSGITRMETMKLVNRLGFKLVERDITPFELINADEIFLTGTAAEIVPVVRLNGVKMGNGKPGPVSKKIIQEFHKLTRDPRNGTPI
ncbi:MAG: branched-chain-amino-acid transaminase [Candidatus Bathyarchaeota archaeon]|nr:branched-chain-amino-acid transaminase [Candidatus Bathyarchaeota archaeon]